MCLQRWRPDRRRHHPRDWPVLGWEKKEGRTMSPMEIIKTPTARKRLLIGMSPGPFSCIAGNIIASYYLGAELDTAGITSSNQQLKAVACPLFFPS
jgi:hypothetical protein